MSHSEEGPGRRVWGAHSPTMRKGDLRQEEGLGSHLNTLTSWCAFASVLQLTRRGSAAISQGPRLHCAGGGLPKAGPAPSTSVSL